MGGQFRYVRPFLSESVPHFTAGPSRKFVTDGRVAVCMANWSTHLHVLKRERAVPFEYIYVVAHLPGPRPRRVDLLSDVQKKVCGAPARDRADSPPRPRKPESPGDAAPAELRLTFRPRKEEPIAQSSGERRRQDRSIQ